VGRSKRTNPIDAYVGNRVLMRRLMLAMSQRALGEAVGLASSQIQKYETGASRITAGRLCELAQALKVQPEYFFEGAPQSDKIKPDPNPPSLELLDRSPDAVEDYMLVRCFLKIEDRQMKRRILALVQCIADSR
jgi:transcriptional regulator with XRE-family HTH domain